MKSNLEFIVRAIWNDRELQEAITYYGEWNGTELDKVFERVLAKYI